MKEKKTESGRSQAKPLVKLPRSLRYKMPAEWEPHFATWLAFPHHKTDFPGKLSAVAHVFAEMARVITQGERLRLLVRDEKELSRAEKMFSRAGVEMSRVHFVLQDTNRSWLRDSMPIFLTRPGSKKGARKSGNSIPTGRELSGRTSPSRSEGVAVNFRFNGWNRYRDHRLDDEAGRYVATNFARKMYFPREGDEPIVLEGGSIDVDAAGTLLTTDECLLTSPRARFVGTRETVAESLSENLGIKKVIWLPQGIVGDDTSGHVDDFARFAPKNRVLICEETRKGDENYQTLKMARKALRGQRTARGKELEIVSLPMPQAVFYDGERLPASYANFYICNAAVLVPVFNDVNDSEALSIIARCFPDRPVIGIYARDLVAGLGTLHCSTMQEPL